MLAILERRRNDERQVDHIPSTTRERIVDSSATLFRRQGYTATGVKQIVAEAEAPFSSLYHFFPGGKDQLAEEVIRTSGLFFGQLVEASSTRPPTSSRASATSSPAPARRCARPTTPTPARSPRSRSRWPARTSRFAWPPPRCSRAGSPPGPSASPRRPSRGGRTRAGDRHDRRAGGRIRAQPGDAHDRAARGRRRARRRRRQGGSQRHRGYGRVRSGSRVARPAPG